MIGIVVCQQSLPSRWAQWGTLELRIPILLISLKQSSMVTSLNRVDDVEDRTSGSPANAQAEDTVQPAVFLRGGFKEGRRSEVILRGRHRRP